jgi:hypothetical protein
MSTSKVFFFLASVFLAVAITGCGPVIKKGEKVQIGRETVSRYWDMENTEIKNDTVLLRNAGAKLTSRFKAKNFIISVDLSTTSGAEGTLSFHTTGDENALSHGYSVMINNSDYRTGNPQKTGSLSLIRNNFIRTVGDDQWFNLKIEVRSNYISVLVNEKMISEYIQPPAPTRIESLENRVLSDGRVVLMKSNNSGQIFVGDMQIEVLDPDLVAETDTAFIDDSTGEILTLLNQQGFPVIDCHGHLKGGLTAEQICQHGRINGYNYGIAPNCGLNFPVTNDSSLLAYYNEIAREPLFKAMQCEGREWITLFTPDAISRYDYIFTDAMTWTDHKGRRMRLWMPEETFVEDEQKFMDMLVAKIEAIMSQEPVDIYVNPTYLPEIISNHYHRLWTPERMDRVIRALVANDIALEINSRFRIPSIAFVKRAKAAGVKFTLGTNNAGNDDLGRLEYSLKVIKEAGITAEDMFIPRPSGDKKVMKKGLPAKITG